MKKIYRDIPVDEYWTNRWSEFEADNEKFEDKYIYPITFAQESLILSLFLKEGKRPKILECGCGLGRVLKHYHNEGYNIYGFDNNALAVKKVRKSGKELKVSKQDVKKLKYKDETFDLAFAFGVFHNVEDGLTDAVRSVIRCVKGGGVVCFSFSAQNICTWLRELGYGRKHFYKWHFTEADIKVLSEVWGISPAKIETIQNIPMLYKYKLFRKKQMEGQNRTNGYKLNRVGETINAFLLKHFPKSFGDTVILIGIKKNGG